MDDLLQQGIAALRAGKREEAHRIFMTVVRHSPESERAWGWMYNVCNTDQDRIHCLKQVLRINPGNEKARQQLDQLLSPAFKSELPLSPVSSTPQDPSARELNAGMNESGFNRTQVFVLLGLAFAAIFIFGFAILYMFVEKDTLAVVPSPTSYPTSAANYIAPPTEVPPTPTLIPTYAYAPTWTPLPSPTSFVIATLVPPTSRPQQAQGNPAPANHSSGNTGSSCSSQLEYAAAMHQYYLDRIDYIHSPLINLYQSWIDEASRNRDALGLVEAQRKLENEKAQVQAEKAAENQRYKAETASIKSTCQ